VSNHYTMKKCGGGGLGPRILNIGIGRRVVSLSLQPPYLRKGTPRTHVVGSWVGPRIGLDAVPKEKILALASN
jgi:hypothetical protein